MGSRSLVRSFFGIVCLFAAHGGVTSDGLGHIETEDLVSALCFPILVHIFPIFLVRILLRFGPRRARGEIKCVRVRRPAERMHFLFALCDRKRLTAIGRNQIELRGSTVLGIAAGIVILRGGYFSFGKKRD